MPPDLDSPCSRHFRFRDFIECGETYARAKIDNVPLQPDTYEALRGLAIQILDPVVDEFGSLELTYGVGCRALTRLIARGIEPRVDQHAGHELNTRGKPICSRGGQAADFRVQDTSSLALARWIVQHTPFDRLYYYGAERPIHVSWSTAPTRSILAISRVPGVQTPPTRYTAENFLDQQ